MTKKFTKAEQAAIDQVNKAVKKVGAVGLAFYGMGNNLIVFRKVDYTDGDKN